MSGKLLFFSGCSDRVYWKEMHLIMSVEEAKKHERGANRPPDVWACMFLFLILHRPFGVDDATAQVLCVSYKDTLSLLSSLVAKQWLFLQNWNHPRSISGPLSRLSPSNDIPWGSAANNIELPWQDWEGVIDCGKRVIGLLWDLLLCQSGSHHRQTRKWCHGKM